MSDRECNVCQHDAAMHDPEDGCHFFRCPCAKFSPRPRAGFDREAVSPAPPDEARERLDEDLKYLATKAGLPNMAKNIRAAVNELLAAAPRADPDTCRIEMLRARRKVYLVLEGRLDGPEHLAALDEALNALVAVAGGEDDRLYWIGRMFDRHGHDVLEWPGDALQRFDAIMAAARAPGREP